MAVGDHIKVQRRLYWHHGIDVGDGSVIHASGEPGRLKLDAEVRRSTLAEFLRDGVAVSVLDADALAPEMVVERALTALGDRGYNLLFNNCEHFARWCRTGRATSEQVDYYALAGTALGLGTRVLLHRAARRSTLALAARALPVAAPLATTLATTLALGAAAVAITSRLRNARPELASLVG